ncbi:hypothetical protein DFS34DRAFT_621986 [Phlyctochytrium arcticum]|nr:hypothetical protein DFS34DRAFT_621986 [Phlyctochytrium arcticum]
MVINVTSDKVNADFPLSVRPDPAKLERDLYLELEASWDSHQRSMQQNVDERWDIWDRIEGITMDVEGKYHTMNVYLNMVIATVPEDMRERHNLLKSVNRVPKLCFTDILRSTIEDQHIEALNPFLFVNARMNFQEAAQVFLSLSILRDRLRRIWACKNSQSDRLIQELTCVRKWKPSDHPRWLVFETEGRLQIRPEQAIFAQHLMEHPGAISQLNMGLGKMRVILPLLILHYANEGQPIPRVHVLSPLLRETIEYLHLHLSASVLGIAILEQPFHRQVNLTAAHVKLLMQSGRRVRRMCCQVVAPEQRLSLEMKLQELELNGVQDTPDALRLLFQQKFVNMFDESDALLSYRFQFIYAVGTPASLDELSTRSTICQALLRTLKEDPAVHQLLTIPNFADLVAPNSPCEFGLLRLTGMSSSDEKRIKLRQTVLHALMQSPPYELTRLRDWCNKSRNNLKQVAKFVIFDESKDKCKLKSRLIAIDSDLWGQVLALRGFLGFGIMEFCLEQRNQVDYGIDPRRLTKRMAVPFRAANVPSERSEFNHPDVSIMLTTLAYYYDGLSKENVRSALKSCLGMGLPAQQRYYTDWIQPIKADLTQNELEMIGDVGRIDLSNAVQFQLLYRKLHRSTELINFWLKVLVLRRDTAQFPQRIGATSWNIADGSHAIGFSGTNDNHRLLPLQVRQHEPAIDSIQGTNGRMVQLLIDHTLETCTLPTQHEPIIWKSLLIFALQGKYSALIDTGSLLAGASNEDAARFLISKTEDFDMKFKGVFYFDSNFAGGGNWMVLDRSTKQVMSRERSPIRDDAAFILFDDARTRGADMKMQYNAVALLTLGPKMTKDRLMQGAGRLRMLGRQQKLVVVATTDIAQNVCSITGASTMQIRDVLQWVMSTTELANKAGLYQWVQQGFTFCTNEGVPIDEDWSLETNYESPVQKISVAEHVANRVGMSADLMFVKVAARGVELGRDVLISSSAWDQMCERELQVERENEAEVAREVPCVKALPEKTWDYSAILQATSVQDLEPFVKFEHIAQSIKRMLVPADLAKVGWQRTNVFATLNFLTTVEIGVGFSANDFIRLIDMVLLIQNEEEQWDLLLLSDKEADAILEIFWGKTLPDNVALVNLTQLRIQMDSNDVDGSASDYMHIGEFQCPEADQGLAALQLFNGETTYSTPERKAALRSMIKAAPHGVASATLQELVSARGRMHDWFYSDLERIIYESLIEQVPIAVRS